MTESGGLSEGKDGRGQGLGIQVCDLKKLYQKKAALNGVSLEVRYGSITVLLGPNGAGKSTLLRILGTTILPDHGSAIIDGHNVVHSPANARRATGLVLGDERSWYWRLSGRQNLEFFAALSGMRRRVARTRSTDLLKLVQLDDVADRRFYGYSSGMKARLSLARALLGSPRVLLLDEPTRTLDPIIAAEFRRIVMGYARDEGKAVLWVTHDLHEATEVGTEAMVLTEGQIALHLPTMPDVAQLEESLKICVSGAR